MKAERINRVIAKWEGWIDAPYFADLRVMKPPGGQGHRVVPDYHGNLRLVHAAMERMTEAEWVRFVCFLAESDPRPRTGMMEVAQFYLRASSEQLAAALVATIGKGEEEEISG